MILTELRRQRGNYGCKKFYKIGRHGVCVCVYIYINIFSLCFCLSLYVCVCKYIFSLCFSLSFCICIYIYIFLCLCLPLTLSLSPVSPNYGNHSYVGHMIFDQKARHRYVFFRFFPSVKGDDPLPRLNRNDVNFGSFGGGFIDKLQGPMT